MDGLGATSGRRRKSLEKVLAHDHRSSIKWWTANLVVVREALKTGKLPDGLNMTEKDRAMFEGFEGFILDNLHMIESTIDGLEAFEGIAAKAIGGWMSGVDEDTILRELNASAGEFTRVISAEKREREKWK